MTTYAVEVSGLSKRYKIATERRDSLKERFVRGSGKYDEFWALRDVDLRVEKGTTFGLIGHNGSGKSTLLKLLAGIYRPTVGTITVRGRISALLELGAGFHGELTGRENVYLNGAILGLSRRQIDDAMADIIAFSGLEEFIDSPVKIYSSGMYVRLGFAVAVTVEPEVLIVDEIIAVGDEEFQRKCFDHLHELRRRGTTIVLVSHSLGLVTELCDQALWLDHGRACAVGPAHDVVDAYLASVNQKEAEDNATSGIEPVPARGPLDRPGSGEVRITGVEFLDAAGSSDGFLTAGEPCTVRMHYEAIQDIPSVTLGLGFRHESGALVAAPNSGVGVNAVSLPRGSGCLDLEIGDLILQPGTFRVSAWASDRGHVYDERHRAFELRVRPGQAVEEPGMVRLPGHWQQRLAADAHAAPTADR